MNIEEMALQWEKLLDILFSLDQIQNGRAFKYGDKLGFVGAHKFVKHAWIAHITILDTHDT